MSIVETLPVSSPSLALLMESTISVIILIDPFILKLPYVESSRGQRGGRTLSASRGSFSNITKQRTCVRPFCLMFWG